MDWTNLGGLAWLLAGGAVFYLMMRKGGCGMSGGHGHSHGHRHGDQETGATRPAQTAPEGERDPVCGMPVEPARAAGTRTAMGRTFYLCSSECLAKFDRDPMAYAGRAMEAVPPKRAVGPERHAHDHGGR